MAHHKSAIKRIRLQEQQRERNRLYKAQMRTAVRRVREAEDKEKASAALNSAYAVIDKLVSKGILHKNTAANKKSSLTHYVNSMT